MWLKLTQLRTPLDFDEAALPWLITRTLKLPDAGISEVRIHRKSLDARHKAITYVYTVFFKVENSDYELDAVLKEHPNLTVEEPFVPVPLVRQTNDRKERPVVVGAGPAGLFAAVRLASAGFRPLIIERGDVLGERIRHVEGFWQDGKLDPESNIQYGIGGAGTFSDGKLTSRSKDPASAEVFEILTRLGAPADIRYWQYPHIGTDLLRQVIERLQALIVEFGGEFRFRTRLSDLHLTENRLTTITLNETQEIETDLLVLATGNSARDVYHLLFQKGLTLEPKAFAVGIRIEHPQDLINKAQYGTWYGNPYLGAAEYHLTYKHAASGRGVYSFCMCPGGYVVASTSVMNGVVTNGMSYQARDSGIANSAIVVTVGPRDFKSESPLAGIYYQETLEKWAFGLGGGRYAAPAQRLADFLAKTPSTGFPVLPPTYRPGVTPVNLWDLLPKELNQALSDGLQYFGRQIRGFDWPDAVLTGVETRTSAPVRIIRSDDRQAAGVEGIYPTGEGAGYAGGIISSALDGWKTAEAILEKYEG